MKPSELDKLRWGYLEKLYELSEGGLHPEVDTRQLKSELGYSSELRSSVQAYMLSKDFISFKCRVPCVRITTRGIDEVERAMKANFAENERRILQKLYDERDRAYTSPHEPEELARELNIDIREVYDIITELEEQRLIGGTDQASWIIPAGIKLIESGGQRAGAAPGISFTTNIHGPNYGGIQQGTHNSTQNVSLTNNQPIGEILPKLVELINAVKQAEFEDKDDVIRDLEKVQQLAQSEDPKSKWALIQTKLTSAKTAMELVGFTYKTLPYWPVIWQYFFGPS